MINITVFKKMIKRLLQTLIKTIYDILHIKFEAIVDNNPKT